MGAVRFGYVDKHERYGAEEGEEESDHRLGCDVLVLSRISSNSPNVHNPLTSGIQFGIFRYPGKMHLKRIEMNCPSRYSCTPPRIIPRIASRMTTKYDPRFQCNGRQNWISNMVPTSGSPIKTNDDSGGDTRE